MVPLLVSGKPVETARIVPALPRSSSGYDFLIVLGSPLGVLTDTAATGKSCRSPTSDDPQCSQDLILQAEALIRDFHHAEKPVLGICLGAQLVARTFGGAVYKLPSDAEHTALPAPLEGEESAPTGLEFGWHSQDFTEAAKADELVGPVLRSLQSSGSDLKFIQWHSDTFDYPKGAVPLSSRPTCPAQAFRYGRRTYAFQYHIEIGQEEAKEWYKDYVEGTDSYVAKEEWEPAVRCEKNKAAIHARLMEDIADGSIARATSFTRGVMLGLLEQASIARAKKARALRERIVAIAAIVIAVAACALAVGR